MSSTASRRMRRKKQQDIKKGIYIQPMMEEFEIPTEEDIQKYIMEKTNKMTYTEVEVLQPLDVLLNNI